MEYLRVTGAWMKLYEVFRHLGSWVGWCGGGLGAAGGAAGHHPFDGAAHGRP